MVAKNKKNRDDFIGWRVGIYGNLKILSSKNHRNQKKSLK
jgi:hypothetical protein